MFFVAPKVLFYSLNVFTLAQVLKVIQASHYIIDSGFHRMDFGVVHVLDFWLTLGRTSKFVPPLWNKGGREGGGDGTPPRSFSGYVTIFRNDFDLSGKTLFFFLTKWGIFYGWCRCGKACNVTNNGRHLGCHLGFYQELEISLKPLEMVVFCASHEK